METTQRLYRSSTNKVIGGVSAGLGDYFDLDPVLVRVLFVLLALFGGGGVFIYIVLWIVIPLNVSDPLCGYCHVSSQYQRAEEAKVVGDNPPKMARTTRQSNTGLVAGIILIFIGGLFLIDRLMPMFHVTSLWPLIFVALGVALIKPELFKTSKNHSHEI